VQRVGVDKESFNIGAVTVIFHVNDSAVFACKRAAEISGGLIELFFPSPAFAETMGKESTKKRADKTQDKTDDQTFDIQLMPLLWDMRLGYFVSSWCIMPIIISHNEKITRSVAIGCIDFVIS
jgi:hypothetical protein